MTAETKHATVTLRAAFQAVAVAAGSGFIAQHLVERVWDPSRGARPLSSTLSGIAVMVLLAAAGSTRKRLAFLSSRHLAVASLTVLASLTILGTVIVQGAPPAALEATYGSAGALVCYLLVDDVFHSMPFAFVMAVAGAGLLLSFFRKGRIDARRAGVLAAHGGCLLVLAGAAVQSFAGIEGRLELHEGETADAFVARSNGRLETVPLGFAVRLDDFELESYEPEVRLRIVDDVDGTPSLVASFDPAEVLGSPSLLAPYGIRMTDYWPDHEMSFDVSPAGAGDAGVPALELGLEDGRTVWLFDTGRVDDGRVRASDRSLITFIWSAERAAPYAGDAGSVSPHVLTTPGGPVRVEVGSTVTLPGTGGRLVVREFLNDLVLDPQTHRAENRSTEPRNPALRVELVDPAGNVTAGTWLFANYPTFHSTGSVPELAGLGYSYEPAGEGDSSWVVVGELGVARRIGTGEEVALADGASLATGSGKVLVRKLLASAEVHARHATRSDRPLRPVVGIERLGVDGGPTILPEGRGADLGSGRHVVLALKEDSDRDYLSTVTILEHGRAIGREVVEVNRPLVHGGFGIYQSDFDPDDLTFSGFTVVRDPGLPVVYLGFAGCLAGILVAFYAGPLLAARRRRGAS